MLAVSTRLPDRDRGRPPVILVHGAANSAEVWTYWLDALAADGWPAFAIDLRGHGSSAQFDLSTTSMADYLDDVRRLADRLRERPVVVGWSMGGLVALASLGRESRYARDDRQRGIVIPSLPCPLLIVTGTLDRQWPRERYADLHLPADHLVAESASHWGLVLNRRALARTIQQVLTWLASRDG